jgi:hypothetical protein
MVRVMPWMSGPRKGGLADIGDHARGKDIAHADPVEHGDAQGRCKGRKESQAERNADALRY